MAENNQVTVSTELIKSLRDETGASVMMVRKALVEAHGDKQAALKILQRLESEFAGKKEDRETKAGRIEAYIHSGARVGVLLELRSETDFVSRNDDFGILAHNIAMHIAAMSSLSIDGLLAEPYIKDPSKTVGDVIQVLSAKFGERIEVRHFIRYEL